MPSQTSCLPVWQKESSDPAPTTELSVTWLKPCLPASHPHPHLPPSKGGTSWKLYGDRNSSFSCLGLRSYWGCYVYTVVPRKPIYAYIYCIWRRKWQPTPVLMPRKSHGRRSLVGYNPWGRKESDTSEWLHFLSFFTVFTFYKFSSSRKIPSGLSNIFLQNNVNIKPVHNLPDAQRKKNITNKTCMIICLVKCCSLKHWIPVIPFHYPKVYAHGLLGELRCWQYAKLSACPDWGLLDSPKILGPLFGWLART